MNGEYLIIGIEQLAAVSLLLVINLALSLWLRLGLVGDYLVATTRMVVQLILLGYLLNWVFARRDPAVVLAMTLIMTLAAGRATQARVKWGYSGMFWNSFVSLLASAYVVTGLAVVGILQVEPWYHPQYVIPLLGMVLGNGLNGITLGLDRFLNELGDRPGVIETRLALGATSWEAVEDVVRDGMHTALTPTINTMMVMGIVSLPGMMTGQILSGVDPLQAVRYQIVIMFMIISTCALGSLGAIWLAYLGLFDDGHRLRREKLYRRKKNAKK